jgi:hypothetical protein
MPAHSLCLRRAFSGCLLAIVAPALAWSQQPASGGACELPATRMHYEVATVDDSPGDWTPAMQATAFGQLERVHDIVRASAPLSPLRGYRVGPVLNTGLPNGHPNFPAEGENALLPSFFVLRFFAPRSWQGACGLKKNTVAVSTVAIVANVPGIILDDQKSPLLSDVPERYYLEPEIIGEVGGFPQYRNGTVLVGPGGRPPLLHVSQEQWLGAVIAMFRHMVESGERDRIAERDTHIDVGAQGDTAAMTLDSVIVGMEQLYESMKAMNPTAAADLRKSIDRMRAAQPRARANAEKMHALQPAIDEQRKKNDIAVTRQLDSARKWIGTIEAYLASLTPEQRRADAYLGNRIEYGYTVPRPGPGDHRIVKLNPDFLDSRKPRESIQVLGVVSSFVGGSSVYRQSADDRFAERVLRAIDYQRLAALVVR